MRKLLALAVFSAIATATIFASNSADAQNGVDASAGATFVALDTSLTVVEDIEAAHLAANLALSEAGQGLTVVGLFSASPEEPQTYASIDEAKLAVADAVETMKSASGTASRGADLHGMLESYSAFIAQLDVSGSTRLVILSAGNFIGTGSQNFEELRALVETLRDGGVIVDTVSLNTTSTGDRELLASISGAASGVAHDLGFVGGVIDYINGTLGIQLAPSLHLDSPDASGESIAVDVPPHSSYLIAGFEYDDSDSVHVIEQPNGQLIEGAVGSVSAVTFNGMKFLTVRNPEAGVWLLRSTGSRANLTLYSNVVNRLSITLPELAPFPVNEPIVLTANANFGDIPLIDASASIEAQVTDPDGQQHSYLLNDRGQDGDQYAEDGIFSMAIGPQSVAGVREVRMSMRWSGVSATIDGLGYFVVEQFPYLETAYLSADSEIFEDVNTHLANVDVKLSDLPFLIEQEAVSVSLTNLTDSSPVEFELVPVEVIDDKIYQLQVFAVLPMSGEYELNASLRGNHLGREFEAVAVLQSRSIELTAEAGLPTIVIAAIGTGAVLVIICIILVIAASMRIKPYGVLYHIDPEGTRELVADFAQFRHSLFDWLFDKSTVPLAALPAVPLRGGRLVFSADQVFFRYQPERDGILAVSIRGDALQSGDTGFVDGDRLTIEDETYEFSTSRPDPNVRVASRLQAEKRVSNEELENFALDPMAWDAPSGARPTRRKK